MTTPTTYPLEYDDEGNFCSSGPCGSGPCLNVVYFNTRPQNFCQDVTLQMDCTINGNLNVTNPQITVGEITYRPTEIIDLLGRRFNVLAVLLPPIPPFSEE